VVKTVVRQAVPLQPMEVHSGADNHPQTMEDLMEEQIDVPRGDLTLEQAPGKTCVRVERAAPPEQVCWQDL